MLNTNIPQCFERQLERISNFNFYMKINVYIEGFHLYYGAIKNPPFKWLDLMKMSELLFPNDTINKIKYFSARVSARLSDPDQPIRQSTYWRALQTIPNLSIIEGSFLVKPVMMPLANTSPQTVAEFILDRINSRRTPKFANLILMFISDFEFGNSITLVF